MERLLPGILFVTVLVAFAALCVVVAIHRRAVFNKRFPSISDEEFLARCTPGTDRDIALRVRKVLSVVYGVDEDRIYPSSRLIQDLEDLE